MDNFRRASAMRVLRSASKKLRYADIFIWLRSCLECSFASKINSSGIFPSQRPFERPLEHGAQRGHGMARREFEKLQRICNDTILNKKKPHEDEQ